MLFNQNLSLQMRVVGYQGFQSRMEETGPRLKATQEVLQFLANQTVNYPNLIWSNACRDILKQYLVNEMQVLDEIHRKQGLVDVTSEVMPALEYSSSTSSNLFHPIVNGVHLKTLQSNSVPRKGWRLKDPVGLFATVSGILGREESRDSFVAMHSGLAFWTGCWLHGLRHSADKCKCTFGNAN